MKTGYQLHESKRNAEAARVADDFLRSVNDAFLRAEGRAGHSPGFCYSVAGMPVKLRFAGDVLVPVLTPALQHLGIKEPEVPAFTVCIFDGKTTGVSIPELPWNSAGHRGPGAIEYYDGGHLHIAFQSDVQILSIVDISIRLAFFWIKDPALIPYYEFCSPLRKIMHWWMLQNGIQMVHTAAVGTAEGGVLLAGKGGSGKSTSALACIDSPLQYLADDSCLLQISPEPRAYGLYNSAKLEEDNLFRFPHFKGVFCNDSLTNADKALVFIHECRPGKLVGEFPVRALLLPRINGGMETTISRVSPARGLTVLAPSTLFHLPGAGARSFQIMASLTKSIPCYALNLGTDLSSVPMVISALLAGEYRYAT